MQKKKNVPVQVQMQQQQPVSVICIAAVPKCPIRLQCMKKQLHHHCHLGFPTSLLLGSEEDVHCLQKRKADHKEQKKLRKEMRR